MTGRPFVFQGHRGARGLRPENTLPSFEAALDAGATSLETDIHLTADGVPVLIHDPYLGACFAPAAETIRVHELTAAELRRHIADRNSDPRRFPNQSAEPTPLATWFTRDRGHSYQVPTLADLYSFVLAYAGEPGRRVGKTDAQRTNAARVVIDVELKAVPFRAADLGQQPGRMEDRVLVAIRSADAVARTAVRSFDHRCVRHLRKLEPGLTGVAIVAGTAPVDPVALARAADARVYGPDFQFLDEQMVGQCHAAGIDVLPWTVNDPGDWERLIAWGVDGITTDYPDRLAAWLSERGERTRVSAL